MGDFGIFQNVVFSVWVSNGGRSVFGNKSTLVLCGVVELKKFVSSEIRLFRYDKFILLCHVSLILRGVKIFFGNFYL